MRIDRWAWILVAAGCAPAAQVPPERLRISAQDAAHEARTVALSWSADASLRYVEGTGLTPAGYILPGAGEWRFVYEAPGESEQLVVAITPRTVERAMRPPQSPPGLVLGDATLPANWIDSPAALAAVRAAGADGPVGGGAPTISALLAPLRPPSWIVRIARDGEAQVWRIDARTGEVVGP